MQDDNDLVARARGPAAAGRADLRVRGWVLLLLESAARTGVSPISKLRYHRLAYVANCVSRVYELPATDQRIVKHRRGPFYPNLQWHLDRLVGQGLAGIANVRYFTDADGAWMDADYAITQAGVDVVERLCAIGYVDALARFLLEVMKAYAAQQDVSLDEVLLEDLTYDDDRKARGAVIEFRRLQDNLSVQAAESFAALVRDPRALTAGDRVHLYVEYLDRKHSRRVSAGE